MFSEVHSRKWSAKVVFFELITKIFAKFRRGAILIVFNTERGTTYGHAAIYLGNDSYIHAPKPGDVVKINKSGAKTNFKHVFRFY